MKKSVAIIGAGPAGLIAAEKISAKGHAVTVYERKPSPGRKFLMAGRGGLNLTHSERLEYFTARYGFAEKRLKPIITKFPPSALRAWCEELGETTFIGSSGRIFPGNFKASPLLRAWMSRLEKLNVRFLYQHEWRGWNDDDSLIFKTPDGGIEHAKPDATLLALGGASWPRLGSDGSWVDLLARKNISISPLRPSNCGFFIEWSDLFQKKFAGHPLKPVTVSFNGTSVPGEIMISAHGIEGGAIYTVSGALRDEVDRNGSATFTLDLRPDVPREDLLEHLETPRRGMSFSNFIRRQGGLSPVAGALLREADSDAAKLAPENLAMLIKALPLRTASPFAMDRAISSAGGIIFEELDENLMLRKKPGVFVAGEMLDWEAPTGGYLLQACFSTGVQAAEGIHLWLQD